MAAIQNDLLSNGTVISRDEFVLHFQHEIDGWVLDAAIEHRKGGELSLFLKVMRNRIVHKLGVMYDTVVGSEPCPAMLPMRKAT
jgi:hypothetical protein